MSFLKSHLDVDHGQHEEYKGLNGINKPVKKIDRQGGHNRHQHKKQHKNKFFTEYVAKKSNSQRQRARQVAQKFNRQHQGGEKRYGAGKMLNIFSPMFPKPNVVIDQKDTHSHGRIGIQVGRGGHTPGHKADKIREEDEYEYGD